MSTNGKLVHGNQMITDFIFGRCTKFFNSDIEETMKKILSGFRYSGHVTTGLTVTENKIKLETKHGNFEVIWNDAMPGYYVGISDNFDHAIVGYLYIGTTWPKKKTDQTLRKVFSLFTARINYLKKREEFSQVFPYFFQF
jgi:hypothetical protein